MWDLCVSWICSNSMKYVPPDGFFGIRSSLNLISDGAISGPPPSNPHFFNTKCPFCCIPLPTYPGNRQMLAKPSSNLLQKPGWRTFMMTRLCWILGYRRQEIWCEIGLSRNGCHCTALCTRSGACYYWIGQALNNAGLITGVLIATQRSVTIKR